VRGADDYVGIDINRAARVSSAAHGGQILVSESTRVLSEHELPEGVMMRDLGHYRLKGLHRPERLFEVVVDGLTGDFPPPLTARADSVHVPVRLTSFIGRQAEIETLLLLLAQSRIVTLTGAGGTGKTSLAVEAGRKAVARFADGVWFVDLAPLDDVSQLESAVTGALGLSTKSQRPTIEILEDHLAGRQLLLILDNFEHLLPGAELVARLISAAPHLTVVVTSRTGLNLYGEQVFPVPPLGVPESFAVGDPDQVAGTGAVALFVERARAVRPDFSLNADNAGIVSDICRRLDGLPLAIELAASRVRVLDVDEILERLDQRLPVLPTGETNRPARHQTLERLIGWSYDLLRPTERRLFERLSIFVGGHTIEAADSICNPAGDLGIDMLEGIASLEGHSLIRRIPSVKPARFEMLETIRRYAEKLLRQSEDWRDHAERHLLYYRDLAESAQPHLTSVSRAGWLERLDSDYSNLRRALRTALDFGYVEDGLRLASSVWRYWFERGYLREGREWLESLLALGDTTETLVWGKAYSALGGIRYWLSDAQGTESAYQEALRIYRAIGDERAVAEGLYDYAFSANLKGDPDEASKRFEASMKAARETELPSLIARNEMAFALKAMAEERTGDAVSQLERVLEVFRQMGDPLHASWALAALGHAHIAMGDLERGRADIHEALRPATDTMNFPILAADMRAIAKIESIEGRHTVAVRLTGAAQALEAATGARAPVPEDETADLKGARAALGDEAFDEAMEEGSRMTAEEAVDYVWRVIEAG
ncbi:MAG: AAA family ATPase, partial [Acidimicrobiia bacterium]